MIRPHLRLSLCIGVSLLMVPSVLISEQAHMVSETSVTPPLEVLVQSTPLVDNASSMLLKLENKKGVKISSPCTDNFSIVYENENHTIIQWKNTDDCKVQLITFNGVNYIIPLGNALPSRSTLSDVSTETLVNTLRASSLIRNDFRLGSAKVQEFFYNIEAILEARRTPFALPITGAPLPTSATFLPNAPRPYRAKVTDGVHHGWDFYTKSGTPVKAIEDGTIVHVKRDFEWSEMDHLEAGHTDLEKQVNLDTYRGNTVYLKTLSGHVAIYAHLGNIPMELEEGNEISRGTVLGEVGDSAVPDKAYLYHLHFELAMNPFNEEKAGQNTFEDALLWPFWGKGKKMEWIKANDEYLFE